MHRGEYVFCIGFEGSTAIVDGRLQRRYGSYSTRQLAEEGLFKQALCSAVWSGKPEELAEVFEIFNQKTAAPVRSAEELARMYGVSGVPEGVKKVTIV